MTDDIDILRQDNADLRRSLAVIAEDHRRIVAQLMQAEAGVAALQALARAAVAYVDAPADDANVADLYDELERAVKMWNHSIK